MSKNHIILEGPCILLIDEISSKYMDIEKPKVMGLVHKNDFKKTCDQDHQVYSKPSWNHCYLIISGKLCVWYGY